MSMLPHPTSYLLPYNASLSCDGDLERDSCYHSSVQLGEYDSVAVVRMVGSCLSILGAISIVSWAIIKKQVCSPRVHPIFVLSLADTILSVLYLVGGTLWLRKAPSRVSCLVVSLPTLILECVTVNLTVVYALLAYSSIKTRNLNNLLTAEPQTKKRFWGLVKNTAAYLIAWLTPIIMVMVLFGILSGDYNLVSNANACSCYCLPAIGNIIPLVTPRDEGSAMYYFVATTLVFTYGVILMAHYLVCFILLVVIYHKLLKYIKTMRRNYEKTRGDINTYGATGALLIQGQSKARKRVLYFFTVFVVNGFFNFILSLFLVILDGINIKNGPSLTVDPYFRIREQEPLEKFYIIMLCLQSITVSFQGFLNAIVYGWTREDFLNIMVYTNRSSRTVEDDHSRAFDRYNELEKSVEFSQKAFAEEETDMTQRSSIGSRILNLGRRKKAHPCADESIDFDNQTRSHSLIDQETGFSDDEIR